MFSREGMVLIKTHEAVSLMTLTKESAAIEMDFWVQNRVPVVKR